MADRGKWLLWGLKGRAGLGEVMGLGYKGGLEGGVNKNTPGRRQSKTLSTIDERGSKIDRNSVFDCHLSPV